MDVPESERRALLLRAQRGDAGAFARLTAGLDARLLTFLQRHAGRLAGSDSDAEDLLQIVLAQAWRLLPGFEDRGPESLYRWLVAIGRNALQDRRRYLDAKGRARGVSLDDPASWATLAADQTSVAHRAIRRENAARVTVALDQLEPQYRSVVEHHFVEGLTLGEIGARLGITKNAVWERLHRGLETLRRLLRPTPTPSV